MKSWYLLYCKRGEQKRATLHLENQGIECYYPEIEVEKVVRGKRKQVFEPLFPSYIFIGIELDTSPSFTTIRSTRGVMDFVRFGGQPYQVALQVIEHLQQFKFDEKTHSKTTQSGQLVHIKSGMLSGLNAIYKEPDGEKRSILLITLINQQIEVKVNNEDVDWHQ